MNRKWTRREFLQKAGAATLGTMAMSAPRLSFGTEFDAHQKIAPKADTLIVLWMAGGMPHTDTFDPKNYTPFEKGMSSDEILTTFPLMNTSVDGVKFTDGLPELASVMDRATLIRSMQFPDLGKIIHTRHQFHWHTGYVPPLTVAVPHIGALMSRVLGPVNPDIPAFIDIGQSLEIKGVEELRAFMSSGFLGSEYGSLHVADPMDAMRSISPPEGFSNSRFQNRYRLYKKLVDQNAMGQFGSDFQRESLMQSMDNAHKLLSSPSAKAFNLSQEPKEVYDQYNTSRFGLGCLLARRLVEEGARYIEVSSEYVPFDNWDTHNNGHERTAGLMGWIDRPVAQLVRDLEQRGLLDRTLIVLASEFSRVAGSGGSDANTRGSLTSVKVQSPTQYGLHSHYADGGSVLLFGGGLKRGHVHGATSDERPCQTVLDPVSVMDLHATLFTLMGISPKLSFEVEKRPFFVTEDGAGKAVSDIMA